MKVAIVGGGITGLVAAYRLSQAGHQVNVYEKENCLGGLAAGFKKENWRWSLERFFHHLFASDQEAVAFIKEIGLGSRLSYLPSKTSIFKDGLISPFDSPLAVLQFSHLPLIDRLRVGLVTSYLKMVRDWRPWEKITAQDWLVKAYGQKAHQLLWQPLLQGKFGFLVDQISMAWFWSRIKKRTRQLIYFQGGFQVFIDALARKIKKNGGKIILKRAVKDISDLKDFERIIITMPTPEFLKMKFLPRDYQKKLGQLKFVSAFNLILRLKEQFLTDGTYWLNINEKNFPFVAVVEHTNFIAPKYYGGQSLLYVGGYYPQNHRYFSMKPAAILKEFLPYLKKINASFHSSAIINYQSSQALFAQPVMPLNYSKMMPSMKTPVKNVYLANQSLVYPWDRGVNYAIKLGEAVARLAGG